MSKGESWPPWEGQDMRVETNAINAGSETTHTAQKLMKAFETINEEYRQLNHDDERERIHEALEVIESCVAYDFESVAEAAYPNSRAMHALSEGRLTSVEVNEHTAHRGLDRVFDIELQVVLPLEPP